MNGQDSIVYVTRDSPSTYRLGITAPDILPPPVISATSAIAGGALAATTTYNIRAVAGNAFGRTTAATGTAVVTTSSNKTGRITIAPDSGAAFYDIYFSTDADPKWVARVTEAQRAAGCLVSGVGVVGAGGVAGSVDIAIAGSGMQSGVTAVTNTAYAIPAQSVVALNRHYIDFDVKLTLAGDGASPALLILVYALNSADGQWYEQSDVQLQIGGAAATPDSCHQRFRVEARDAERIALVVAQLSGTGASLDIYYSGH